MTFPYGVKDVKVTKVVFAPQEPFDEIFDPEDKWILIGILGPRTDGRRYYIFGNEFQNRVYYCWDLEFWHGKDKAMEFYREAMINMDLAFITNDKGEFDIRSYGGKRFTL